MAAKRGDLTVLHRTDTSKSNATELCLRSKSILETRLHNFIETSELVTRTLFIDLLL